MIDSFETSACLLPQPLIFPRLTLRSLPSDQVFFFSLFLCYTVPLFHFPTLEQTLRLTSGNSIEARPLFKVSGSVHTSRLINLKVSHEDRRTDGGGGSKDTHTGGSGSWKFSTRTMKKATHHPYTCCNEFQKLLLGRNNSLNQSRETLLSFSSVYFTNQWKDKYIKQSMTRMFVKLHRGNNRL